MSLKKQKAKSNPDSGLVEPATSRNSGAVKLSNSDVQQKVAALNSGDAGISKVGISPSLLEMVGGKEKGVASGVGGGDSSKNPSLPTGDTYKYTKVYRGAGDRWLGR